MSKENEYQTNEQRDNYSITNHHGSHSHKQCPCPDEDGKLPNEKKKKKKLNSIKQSWREALRSLYHQSSDYKVTGGGGGVGNKVNSTEKTLVWELFSEGPFTMKNIYSATTLYQLEPVFWSYCTLPKRWRIHSVQCYGEPYFYNKLYFLTIYTFFPNPLLFLYRYNALSQLMLIFCDLWPFL